MIPLRGAALERAIWQELEAVGVEPGYAGLEREKKRCVVHVLVGSGLRAVAIPSPASVGAVREYIRWVLTTSTKLKPQAPSDARQLDLEETIDKTGS